MEKNLKTMRHSCSHLLAAAVLKLYPKTKLGIGPAIGNGFYYDFDFAKPITEGDLQKISDLMEKLAKKKLAFEKKEVSIQEAKKIFKDQPYKLELLTGLGKQGEKKVTLYQTGEFIDLCQGPHLKNSGKIGVFKLLSVAGAYWQGSEQNKMLTRIYGTCFEAKNELEKYLWQIEESKKRDHRKIGKELDLWTFSENVGAGLPLFTQKGALVRKLINEFIEDLQSKQGIAQVWTPQITKAELFKISGHYDKYQENMFRVKSNYSNEEFFLKPMNCPQHIQIYASKPRSYKDLPIRMSDFAMLYRDEKPGELSGLTRVRSFSQDDCHIFCREDQILEEMDKALDMTQKIMDTYGFSYQYRLSIRDPKHPEKYLGEEKIWAKAEKLSEDILKRRKIKYFLGIGEATFYAPKLDLIARDSLGRDWQLSTLQIDFFMPGRFNLEYTDSKGQPARVVMLHRAIAGSSERLMAILLEHYAGSLPVWLSPVQVIIIPITDKHTAYASQITNQFCEENIRVEQNGRQETTSAKIRDAEIQKIPYILVVGDKEIENRTVNVRVRGEQVLGAMTLGKFMELIKEDIAKKRQV